MARPKKYADGVDNGTGDEDGDRNEDGYESCCRQGYGGVIVRSFGNGYQETLPAQPGKLRGQETRSR